jgi:DNA-binding XRE family transcriptional regulator
MPTGYPSKGLSPALQKLADARREIDQRMKAERRREKSLTLLVSLARRRGLTAADLRAAARDLDRKKGTAPVATGKKWVPKPRVAAKGKVGKAIRAARIKEGWTHDDVGVRLGVSGATVSAWEVGTRQPAEEYHPGLLKNLKLPKDLLKNSHAAAA